MFLESFSGIRRFHQACLSFVTSVQSKSPKPNPDGFPEGCKHLNAYMTPNNLLYPSRVHPFTPGLMGKILEGLLKTGIVKTETLSDRLSKMEESYRDIVQALDLSRNEDYPARVECGLTFDKDLLQKVEVMANVLEEMDFDYILTDQYFEHVKTLLTASMSMLRRIIATNPDHIYANQLVTIALIDSLLCNRFIEGSDKSFLHNALGPDGADLNNQIETHSRVSVTTQLYGIVSDDAGNHQIRGIHAIIDLLESLATWCRNSESRSENDAVHIEALARIYRSFCEDIPVEDLGADLKEAYLRSLGQLVGCDPDLLTPGTLSRYNRISGMVNAQEAKQAIFNPALLDLAHPPSGYHMAVLNLLKHMYLPEYIQMCVDSIST